MRLWSFLNAQRVKTVMDSGVSIELYRDDYKHTFSRIGYGNSGYLGLRTILLGFDYLFHLLGNDLFNIALVEYDADVEEIESLFEMDEEGNTINLVLTKDSDLDKTVNDTNGESNWNVNIKELHKEKVAAVYVFTKGENGNYVLMTRSIASHKRIPSINCDLRFNLNDDCKYLVDSSGFGLLSENDIYTLNKEYGYSEYLPDMSYIDAVLLCNTGAIMQLEIDTLSVHTHNNDRIKDIVTKVA